MVFRRKVEDYLLTLSEAPGFEFVEKLLAVGADNDRPIVEFIKEKLNFRFLMMKAEAQFSPTFTLSREERKPKKTSRRKTNEKKAKIEK